MATLTEVDEVFAMKALWYGRLCTCKFISLRSPCVSLIILLFGFPIAAASAVIIYDHCKSGFSSSPMATLTVERSVITFTDEVRLVWVGPST